MNVTHIPLADTGIFDELLLDYIDGNPRLRPFYTYSPAIASVPDVIEARSRYAIPRETLYAEFEAQHEKYYSQYPSLRDIVSSLRNHKTYTVTTGHQLCLATGPLYFIYKIISTIKLAAELKNQYPDYTFLPVFWMASEDHDIDEINHLHLFSETIRWDVSASGATGRLPTTGLDAVMDAVRNLCAQHPYAAEVSGMLESSWLGASSLSQATRELLLQLFAKEGLLVLDADSPSLKKEFAHIIKEELSLQPSFDIVNQTNEKLSRFYKTQLHPREINLFYLDEGLRQRIIKDENGHFEVLNTDLSFTREFILDLSEKQPERFSPNVVLRPLYQECILPNIAYVGGPGEIAYWLQLKEVFEHYNVSFPMLVPRNNALILPERALNKFLQLGFTTRDVFRPYDELSRQWILTREDVTGEIEKSKEQLREVYGNLAAHFSLADPTLAASVHAELQKMLNGMDALGKKGTAALKRKHEVTLNQIRGLLDRVNPGGQPQERVLNFLQFYAIHGPDFINGLMAGMHPLDFNMAVFTE